LGIAPKVFDYNPKEGIMISEYIEGVTLDEYLEENPDKVRQIKKKIENVLDKLYDNRIIHGDLAGSNFIIQPNGNIKVIDFSTGRIVSDDIPNEKRDYYITGKMEKFQFGRRNKRGKSRRRGRKSRKEKSRRRGRSGKRRRSKFLNA